MKKLISYEYYVTDPDNFVTNRKGLIYISFDNIEKLEEKLNDHISKKYPNSAKCGFKNYEIIKSI